MTDIIEHDGNSHPAKERPEIRTGGAMGALIPQGIDEAFRLAEGLVKGGGAPRGTNTMQAFTIISKGLEVGFAPLQALSTIASINGRLSIYGDGLIAIARRGGNQLDERLEGNGDARVATCTVTRADTGEVIKRTFSVMDAKTAKLWNKSGPWTQYPDRMLAARARAYAIRDGLADKLFGLHVAEESADIPAQESTVTPSEPPQSAGRLRRRLGTSAQPEISADSLDAEINPDSSDEPDPLGSDFGAETTEDNDDPSQSFDDDFNAIEPDQAA